eukprot:3867561-Prymnesium_polylepis.1
MRTASVRASPCWDACATCRLKATCCPAHQVALPSSPAARPASRLAFRAESLSPSHALLGSDAIDRDGEGCFRAWRWHHFFSMYLTGFRSSERPRSSAFLRACLGTSRRLSSLADDMPESDSSSDSLDDRDTRRLLLAPACFAAASFGGSFERLLALGAGALRDLLARRRR